MRITKEPDERRAELMETAGRLFAERGFASVRVSDIVAAMGVAQGTFYYYFPTKDHVLVALLEVKWQEVAAFIEAELSAYDEPVARLSAALAWMLRPGSELTADARYRILMDPAVAGAFHPAFDAARTRSLYPVMSRVVAYGMERGAFESIVQAAEVVRIVFLGITARMHEVEPAGLPEALSAICGLLERVLGLSSGSIKLY